MIVIGSPYVFGLLQLLISEYLHHQLDITKCDELSAEMLDLLLSLMKFGFYNTAEQIQDVVDPLVEVPSTKHLLFHCFIP